MELLLSGRQEMFVQWVITASPVDAMITLKPDIYDRKNTSGPSTRNAISSLTLPETAFHSRAALLSCRDSIRVWIARERLCRPDSLRLLLPLQIWTRDGPSTVEELVSCSPNAE